MDKHAVVAPSGRRCVGMTKAGLVDKVAATIQLPKHQTETVVNLFLQCVTDALRAGDKVELRGFGSFRLRRRKARVGRNPKTGDLVPIPAKQVPWFTVGKVLRALVDYPPAVPDRAHKRAAPSTRRRVRSA
jgi:integration host factor subunit beta